MTPRPPLSDVQRARLESYAKARANFDDTRISEYNAENGWRIDDYEQELPAEPPGHPLPGGSFYAATEVLRNYSFPPPDLITGVFLPDTPLEDRVMVLRGRFLLFTFWFGVRVVNVIDEVRLLPGKVGAGGDGQEAVWGYSYRTLEGHYERGQIDFSVHKHLRTGRVMFRIHAVSQTGAIPNPFYRLGFRLFGRFLQRRFAHESMRRLKAQVQEMLLTGASTPPEPSRLETVAPGEVPDSVTEKVEEQAARAAHQPASGGSDASQN